MPRSEVQDLTITEVGRLLRSRKLSSLEVTEAAWERIDAHNPAVNAFITLLREQSLLDAREADRRLASGERVGPLLGIPVSVKDLLDTRGVLTTAGTKAFATRVPTEDATVVRRLKDAGAILVGKANMAELAIGGPDHPYGPVANPWDLKRSSGGSSSGSAASTASGMNYASIGSDTGGSIRIPASFCGVVGLKPTYGRVSRRGGVPLSWSSDHFGPLTRSVRDAALVLQTIAGYDPADPTSSKEPVPNFARGLSRTLEGYVIGVPWDHYYDELTTEVRAAMDEAHRTLRKLGARLIDVKVSDPPRSGIMHVEMAAALGKELWPHLELLGAAARTRIIQGFALPAQAYVKAKQVRTLLVREMTAVFENVDALVTPATPIPAYDWRKDPSGLNVMGRNTRMFNMTGQPAMSLPCGFTTDRMPIGLQLAGKPFQEKTILNIGHAYETATEWRLRRPSILS